MKALVRLCVVAVVCLASAFAIDEMGYLPLDDLGATIFFQLVSARYEHGSILLTSNNSQGDWGSIFGEGDQRNRVILESLRFRIRGL